MPNEAGRRVEDRLLAEAEKALACRLPCDASDHLRSHVGGRFSAEDPENAVGVAVGVHDDAVAGGGHAHHVLGLQVDLAGGGQAGPGGAEVVGVEDAAHVVAVAEPQSGCARLESVDGDAVVVGAGDVGRVVGVQVKHLGERGSAVGGKLECGGRVAGDGVLADQDVLPERVEHAGDKRRGRLTVDAGRGGGDLRPRGRDGVGGPAGRPEGGRGGDEHHLPAGDGPDVDRERAAAPAGALGPCQEVVGGLPQAAVRGSPVGDAVDGGDERRGGGDTQIGFDCGDGGRAEHDG